MNGFYNFYIRIFSYDTYANYAFSNLASNRFVNILLAFCTLNYQRPKVFVTSKTHAFRYNIFAINFTFFRTLLIKLFTFSKAFRTLVQLRNREKEKSFGVPMTHFVPNKVVYFSTFLKLFLQRLLYNFSALPIFDQLCIKTRAN